MKINRALLRAIGKLLPPDVAFAIATKSRHLRHLATPGRDYIFDRYLGHFKVLIDTTYPIESAMLTGRYDKDTSDLIERLVQPNWVCIDVGANVGAIALALAKAASSGTVLAIEPGPFLCRRLKKNLELNPSLSGRLRVLELGVSDLPGQLFWNEDNNNRGNAGLLERSGTPVPVSTLDIIVKEQSLPRLDFVKIDVEGMELEVIRGAMQSVSSLRPILYYETLEPFRAARGFDLYTEAFHLLEPAGYKHFAVSRGPRVHPIADLLELKSSNVLAVPSERTADLSSLQGTAGVASLTKQRVR